MPGPLLHLIKTIVGGHCESHLIGTVVAFVEGHKFLPVNTLEGLQVAGREVVLWVLFINQVAEYRQLSPRIILQVLFKL